MSDQDPNRPHQPFYRVGDVPAETPLRRFFQKLTQMFNRTPAPSPTEIRLAGRIHELQTIADHVLHDLIAFKGLLEREADPHLLPLAVSVIDTMIKEIARLKKLMEHQHGLTQQVKAVARFAEWVEKAKPWLALKNKTLDAGQVKQVVVQQTVQEFQTRIDRDIQVIQDYLHHAVDSLEGPDELKASLKNKLMSEISPNLSKLDQLKQCPEDLHIDSIISWRAQADRGRENLFTTILHAIDSYASEFQPYPKENDEYNLVILMQLTELEEKTTELVSAFETIDDMEENQRRATLGLLDKLEDEAHLLNSNLYLSQEQSENVEKLLDILASLREQI